MTLKLYFAPGSSAFAPLIALEDIGRLAKGLGPWLLSENFNAVDAYALVIWRWAERRQIDTAAYPARRSSAPWSRRP